MKDFEQLDLRVSAPLHAQAEELKNACRRAVLVHVRSNGDASATREFWNELLTAATAERISVDESAESGEMLDNLWSNVEFDPRRQNRFRHSRSAQPLHTDGSYEPASPSLIVMFCERAARQGGATVFLDGKELVGRLAAEKPQLLCDLSTKPMAFRKGGREVTSPAIQADAGGPLLRWNYYALSDELGADARALAEEFQQFLLDLARRSIPRAIRLERGDAVFFHDERLLHGRNDFVAEVAGERCLWKGGLRL